MTKKDLVPAAGELFVFVADNGTVQVHVENTNEQLGNIYIYDESEDDPVATIQKLRIVQAERNRTRLRQIARGEGARDDQG